MTPFQILALVALACTFLGTYGKALLTRLPKSNHLLVHIAAVVRVRDAYNDVDVTAACNAVLAALLKVKG